jgi:hypothetical protein
MGCPVALWNFLFLFFEPRRFNSTLLFPSNIFETSPERQCNQSHDWSVSHNCRRQEDQDLEEWKCSYNIQSDPTAQTFMLYARRKP